LLLSTFFLQLLNHLCGKKPGRIVESPADAAHISGGPARVSAAALA
jgi:hypothetical protein